MAESRSSPRGARIAEWLGCAVALAGAAAMLASGLGSRFGLWDYGFAVALLRGAGWLGAAGTVLCLAALPRAWRAGARRALAALLVGVVAGAASFGVAWTMERAASGAPPLHDISTDTADPPQFVALAAVRRASPNGPAYPGAAAEAQRKAYPDILPLAVGAHPAAAYQRCLEAVRALGWQIALADPQAMRVEATDTTRFFGMKNDIVIRVTPLGAASRVDIRSASRVGQNDLGVNARRIRAFYREMARKG